MPNQFKDKPGFYAIHDIESKRLKQVSIINSGDVQVDETENIIEPLPSDLYSGVAPLASLIFKMGNKGIWVPDDMPEQGQPLHERMKQSGRLYEYQLIDLKKFLIYIGFLKINPITNEEFKIPDNQFEKDDSNTFIKNIGLYGIYSRMYAKNYINFDLFDKLIKDVYPKDLIGLRLDYILEYASISIPNDGGDVFSQSQIEKLTKIN